MKNILSALIWISLAGGINFRRTVEFSDAVGFRAFGFDTDQDGRQNLVLYVLPPSIQFWEHIGFDKYVFEDSALPWSYLFDIGYLDDDSLVDMVGSKSDGYDPLYVYESPIPNSHPINIVWYGYFPYNIAGGYITDLDHDGIRELLFRHTDTIEYTPRTCVYENTLDNQYALVWQDTIRESSYFVNGDFDQDGRTDFVTGNVEGEVHIWECVGNDDYQYVFGDTLPRAANYDIFCARDMDGNGKPEFLFTSMYLYYRRVYLYCYEAIEDNTYDYFLIDSMTGLPMGMERGRSVCGDIDGDGIEEIVWSSTNQWHIYKAFGVHDYQPIYSSNWTQHEITEMNVYDLNDNGYPEVIEAWFENGIPSLEAVVIWEIEGVRLHQPNGGEVLHPDQQYLVTWEKFDPPGADSFALFYSHDNGFNYDTIITGLGSNDTSYLWTVPNTISDSCIVMIWACGPPRPGEDVPRGTAWDFSDSVFAIREMGVKAGYREQAAGNSLRILQNPTRSSNVQIQYSLSQPSHVSLKLYNSLGQLLETVVEGFHNAGEYKARLVSPANIGIYFVKYECNSIKITMKMILVK